MVVISLEKCPLALRGDLTKWLQEISQGVYVGQVSARVRERLWERVKQECKTGRATMVYSAHNEQHLDFRVHNTTWEPVDFDGIKLMLRPSPSRLEEKVRKRAGFSDAANRRRAAGRRQVRSLKEPDEYVVLDIETTGLDVDKDEIIECAAVRFERGEECARIEMLVRPEGELPQEIVELTGITQADVDAGCSLDEAMGELLGFVGTCPLVLHNAPFDLSFLNGALEELDEDELDNEVIDTLQMARKKLPSMSRWRLGDLAATFGIEQTEAHRALVDCLTTHDVFVSLLEL